MNEEIEKNLRAFTQWLLEHGYLDDDCWCEGDVVKEFLDKQED